MDELKTLLVGIKKATGLDAVPYLVDTANGKMPAITYTFYRTQDDGAVARYRLLTRVHASTYAEALRISDVMADALVSVGDETKDGLVVEANGGGSLIDEDTNTPQQITYFDILSRS